MKQCRVIAFVLLVAAAPPLWGQSFANGTLAGTIGVSNIPTSWSQVAWNEPMNQATMSAAATSDVTGTTGPISGNISGNPYHGTTYVSGLHMSNAGDTWHEGLQQTVSALTIGQSYTVSFYTIVSKQSNATDNSGSWGLYRDNTLVGTSIPTIDNAAVGSNSHVWQRRTLTFSALASSHLMRFLPYDDDAMIETPFGVRMGIDSITLFPTVVTPVLLPFTASPSGQDKAILHWEEVDGADAQRYFVERSADGIHFESLAEYERDAAGRYTYLDHFPYSETHYRIAALSVDGSKHYSEMRMVRTGSALSVYHGHDGRIHLAGGTGGEYAVTLIDMQGRTVLQTASQGSVETTGLAPGTYFLRATSILKPEEQVAQRVLVGY